MTEETLEGRAQGSPGHRRRILSPRRAALLVSLVALSFFFSFVFYGDEDRIADCPDPDESLCLFVVELEKALQRHDVQYVMDRLDTSTYTCPIDLLGVVPCEAEPDGSQVERIGEGLLIDQYQGLRIALISPELFRGLLNGVFMELRSFARDEHGSGAPRVYATGHLASGDEAAVLITALIPSLASTIGRPGAPTSRIALAFEARSIDGAWMIHEWVSILPPPDALQAWIELSEESGWDWQLWEP